MYIRLKAEVCRELKSLSPQDLEENLVYLTDKENKWWGLGWETLSFSSKQWNPMNIEVKG
jgi:hypothetical protein